MCHVFGRALHLQHALGGAVAGLTPLLQWDAAADLPRSSAEIVHGLELTWRVIVDCVMRGAPTDDVPAGEGAPDAQTIWGLLDHDLAAPRACPAGA